ncbi:hypothetical protein, partial [Nocardia gamkensis]|uniref:hypothetical protein n=1 Tax=Nocardia gamkensis TaxID=352869 RepID=UPI001B34C1F8
TETLDHPMESGVERLRHHLRRPTQRWTEVTQSNRVTPMAGQTPERDPVSGCATGVKQVRSLELMNI